GHAGTCTRPIQLQPRQLRALQLRIYGPLWLEKPAQRVHPVIGNGRRANAGFARPPRLARGQEPEQRRLARSRQADKTDFHASPASSAWAESTTVVNASRRLGPRYASWGSRPVRACPCWNASDCVQAI